VNASKIGTFIGLVLRFHPNARGESRATRACAVVESRKFANYNFFPNLYYTYKYVAHAGVRISEF
jgi:hypothetical protein